MLYFLILILPFYVMSNTTNQNKKCNEWLRDHVFYNTEFHADINQNQSLYIQFDSFNQLNQIGCPQNFQLEMDYLLLYPSRKLLIDDNLNLVDMLTMSYMENLIIRIKNILGFNQFTLNETLKQRKGLKSNKNSFLAYFYGICLQKIALPACISTIFHVKSISVQGTNHLSKRIYIARSHSSACVRAFTSKCEVAPLPFS